MGQKSLASIADFFFRDESDEHCIQTFLKLTFSKKMMKYSHKISLRILQHNWKKAIRNPSGPGNLSPLKFCMTSKISASSKSLSSQSALSSDILENTKTSRNGQTTCCLKYKFIKN